jgi:hypothetical protein
MKQKEKADLNRRALEALGFRVEDGWVVGPDEEVICHEKAWQWPDLIGDPDGTGGCWGQVMVANRLNLMPCGWRWYCTFHDQLVARIGDSPGEAVARLCISAAEKGLKLRWRSPRLTAGSSTR